MSNPRRDWLLSIWDPNITVSNDGKPLISSVSDLYQFPYHRLPTSLRVTTTSTTVNDRYHSYIVSAMIRPEIVISLLTFYLFISKPLLQSFQSMIRWNPKTSLFRLLIIVHNLLLTIFSAIVAYCSWNIVLKHWYQHGFVAIYCDASSSSSPWLSSSSSSLWDSGLGSWSIIFYISKYYEFVDTWILVLKKKKPSLLQVYHHTGIALIMWIAVMSHSSWLLFVVLLNSVIHTFMYFYFFIKTISPTTEIAIAKYLTMAQITQFMIGIICTLPLLLNYPNRTCISNSSRFALACLHTYGFGLIALFVQFAFRKYHSNKNNNKSLNEFAEGGRKKE